ncbi:MAG: O-antigen ligase family protein [Proteobacteria bacterium]|nr:O-antigen ligase family protein [Pseudomonadota bacterium]
MIATLSQRLAVLFAFLAGPVGVLAPKGMTVLVVGVGLAGLARWAGAGFQRSSRYNSLVVVLAALALWAAVSVAWSFEPSRALSLVVRLTAVAMTGAGLLFAFSRLDPAFRHRAENGLLVGVVAGLAIITVGFFYAKISGNSLWGTYFFDPLTTLNNGAVAISLLAWPAMAVAWRRNRTGAVLVAAMAYAGLLFLSSGTALLAPLLGLVGFIVVWFLGRRGALALAVVIPIFILAAPHIFSYSFSADAVKEISQKLPASAKHRLAMWSFAVEKIDEKPFMGWGMDASRFIPQEDRRLGGNMEIMPLHPHNAFLQVRLELGMPGIILAAVFVGLFFAGIRNVRDRFAAALMAAAGGAYLTVASLSYGIWQNWWVAFAWALAALTSLALRRSSSGE